MNILQFLHFFVFLFYSYLLIFLLWKDPKSLLNRACAAFFASLALWSFAYIFVHNFNISKDTARLFDNISSIGWASFAAFFLWFSLIFTEKKKIIKTKIIYPLIFILPLLFIYTQWAGLLTVDYIKRYWGWEAVWSSSIWWHSYFYYYLLFTAIGLYLIFNFRRKTKEPIKKKQAGIIFVATLITLILGILTDVIFPVLYIYVIPPLGDVNTLSWAFGIVYAIAKYKLMVITPAAAAENIISTMADSLILLDREGNIINVNKATLYLSGYRKSELEGKSVEIFFAEKDFKSTLLDKAIKREIIRNYEFSFKTKTGDNIPVIFSSSAMMDEAGAMAGIVCIVKDITERKLAEENVKNAKDELQMILDSVPAIIFYKDIEGRFIRVNKTLANSLQLPIKDIVGKTTEELFPKEQAENMRKDDKEVIVSEKAKRDIIQPFTTPDGIRWLLTDKIPYKDKKGKITGIISLAKDITGERKSEKELRQSYQKLKKTMNATINTMSSIIETKDPYTSGHQHRVCQLAIRIAQEMTLPEDKIEGIRIASLIHDIGKIGLPTEILSKPTKLSDLEFSLIKNHSQIGYNILKSIDFSYPVARIVLQHHERPNGSGYPNNLKGDKILLEARIIGVADVVEAMSSYRPYRPALGIDKALEEISKNKGILYDPKVVDACLKLFKEKGFEFK
ncbi:MAG: PAS domain S-box protein [Candidatus Atribacteria bacterium]|nr:PAS domain S-box protein [Candidatus Atribacteria bacterium]